MKKTYADQHKRNSKRYILITLARADQESRKQLTKELVAQRIAETNLDLKTIIVAREQHQEKGHHFHVGVLLVSGLLAKGAPKRFREIFPGVETTGTIYLTSSPNPELRTDVPLTPYRRCKGHSPTQDSLITR